MNLDSTENDDSDGTKDDSEDTSSPLLSVNRLSTAEYFVSLLADENSAWWHS